MAGIQGGQEDLKEQALRWIPEDGKQTEIPAETTIGHFSSLSPLQMPALSASLLIADDNADMREYLRKLPEPYFNQANAKSPMHKRAPAPNIFFL